MTFLRQAARNQDIIDAESEDIITMNSVHLLIFDKKHYITGGVTIEKAGSFL